MKRKGRSIEDSFALARACSDSTQSAHIPNPPPLRPLTYYDRMANVERARAWHELPSLVP
jgi:hypothetical protein